MTKKEYHRILNNLKNMIDDSTIESKSTWRGVKYDSYAACRELLYIMTLKAESDTEYMELFSRWLKKGGTLLTRSVCRKFDFSEKIDKKYNKIDSGKYPLPFSNAEEWLGVLLSRMEKR